MNCCSHDLEFSRTCILGMGSLLDIMNNQFMLIVEESKRLPAFSHVHCRTGLFGREPYKQWPVSYLDIINLNIYAYITLFKRTIKYLYLLVKKKQATKELKRKWKGQRCMHTKKRRILVTFHGQICHHPVTGNRTIKVMFQSWNKAPKFKPFHFPPFFVNLAFHW